MLSSVRALSIAIDAGNNKGTSYLDLRVTCYSKNNLQNFHLIAIPTRERHTGKHQYSLIVTTFDVLAPQWRHQLIGVASDGASAMSGCVQGTCTHLERECHNPIFRIWCGAHQLDLVVKKAFKRLCSERFVNQLTAVTAHLRRQPNLQAQMKSKCPTFVTTRWISMGNLLAWLKQHRVKLEEYFNEKLPACRPTREWWLVVSIIQPLVERIEKTFVSLHGDNALVHDQRQQFTGLIRDISSRCKLEGPLTVEEQIEFSETLEENPSYGYLLEEFAVERDDIIRSFDELGGFVQQQMDLLQITSNVEDKTEIDRIISTVAVFSLDIVVGVSKIVAERNSSNKAGKPLPPVLPLTLCSMDPRMFTASLEQQRSRLQECHSSGNIEKIDDQFIRSRWAVREESGLKGILQQVQSHSDQSSFEDCWSPLKGRGFDELRNYCGGIASVMPGTASVESDFSIINWTKDPNTQRLTDFSLEAILHCKQFGRMRKLFEE